LRLEDAGFDPKAAAEWAACGFTPEEAKEWRQITRHTAKLARAREQRPTFFPEESLTRSLALWRDLGVDDPLALLTELDERARSQDDMFTGDLGQWLKVRELGVDIPTADAIVGMGLAAYFEQLVKGGVDLGVASSLAVNKDNPGITPQRVRDWLERYPDLQPYIEAIVAFERIGIDPDAYAPWHRGYERLYRHIRPQETVCLWRAGYRTPDEAHELIKLRDDQWCYDLLFNDNPLKLKERGIGLAELRACLADWPQHGGQPRVKPLLEYLDGGGDIEGYRSWLRHKDPGVLASKTLFQLDELQIGPQEFNSWVPPQIDTSYLWGDNKLMLKHKVADDLIALREAGAMSEDVKALHELFNAGKRGRNHYRKPPYTPIAGAYRAMRQAKLTPKQLAAWYPLFKQEGDVEEAIKTAGAWHRAGFDPEESREWLTPTLRKRFGAEKLAGVVREAGDAGLTPRQLSTWIRKDFTLQQALAWRKAGVGRPGEAAKLLEQGITPDDLSQLGSYLKLGLGPAQANAWRDSGIAPDEAERWIKGGVSDPVVTAEGTQAGVGLEEALEYESARAAARSS